MKDREIINNILEREGFLEDGITADIEYKSTPEGGTKIVYGRGRDRFWREKDDLYATVGVLITCFYKKTKKGRCYNYVKFDTKDIPRISRYINKDHSEK